MPPPSSVFSVGSLAAAAGSFPIPTIPPFSDGTLPTIPLFSASDVGLVSSGGSDDVFTGPRLSVGDIPLPPPSTYS